MVLELQLDGIGCCLCEPFTRKIEAHKLIPLISLYGTASVVGFDASGHVAEELKNAR